MLRLSDALGQLEHQMIGDKLPLTAPCHGRLTQAGPISCVTAGLNSSSGSSQKLSLARPVYAGHTGASDEH